MKWLFRWKNAQYISELYEAAEIYRLLRKTKWVKMPNVINVNLNPR